LGCNAVQYYGRIPTFQRTFLTATIFREGGRERVCGGDLECKGPTANRKWKGGGLAASATSGRRKWNGCLPLGTAGIEVPVESPVLADREQA